MMSFCFRLLFGELVLRRRNGPRNTGSKNSTRVMMLDLTQETVSFQKLVTASPPIFSWDMEKKDPKMRKYIYWAQKTKHTRNTTMMPVIFLALPRHRLTRAEKTMAAGSEKIIGYILMAVVLP